MYVPKFYLVVSRYHCLPTLFVFSLPPPPPFSLSLSPVVCICCYISFGKGIISASAHMITCNINCSEIVGLFMTYIVMIITWQSRAVLYWNSSIAYDICVLISCRGSGMVLPGVYFHVRLFLLKILMTWLLQVIYANILLGWWPWQKWMYLVYDCLGSSLPYAFENWSSGEIFYFWSLTN